MLGSRIEIFCYFRMIRISLRITIAESGLGNREKVLYKLRVVEEGSSIPFVFLTICLHSWFLQILLILFSLNPDWALSIHT
jgi:hypothetical protein